MAKLLKGVVVSVGQQSSARVRVDRMVVHPKYGKRYRSSKKFTVHDPDNRLRPNDLVTIKEIRPMSKTKRWAVVATQAAPTPTSTVTESIS